MKLAYDSGTEKWIRWAKDMHGRLSALRKRLGLSKLQRAYAPESGTLVWLMSSQQGDWIRITGGVAGTSTFSADGITSYAFLVGSGGGVVAPPSLESAYNALPFWYNVEGSIPSLSDGLYRLGVGFDAPVLDGMVATGFGTYTEGFGTLAVPSSIRAVFIGDEALLADDTDPYNEVYLIYLDYTADPEAIDETAAIAETQALLFPAVLQTLTGALGISTWEYYTTNYYPSGSGSPNDWVATTAFNYVPANHPAYDPPVTWDRQVSSYRVVSPSSGNYLVTAAVVPYSTAVTIGAEYHTDDATSIDWAKYTVDQNTRFVVERIDLRTGVRTSLVDDTLTSSFNTVLKAPNTGSVSYEIGYHFKDAGAITNPPADRAYAGDRLLVARNASYNPTLLVNDNGDWIVSKVLTYSPAVGSAGGSAFGDPLPDIYSWNIDHPFDSESIPYVYTVRQDITLDITSNEASLWSQALTGTAASFPTSTTRQVERHGTVTYFALTSPYLYSVVGRFSATFIGAEAGPASTAIRKGLWFDGASVVEITLDEDEDRLVLHTPPGETSHVLAVDGKWAKFYVGATLVETLVLAAGEVVDGASVTTPGVYYTSADTTQRKHKLVQDADTLVWSRTESDVAVEDTKEVGEAPNAYTNRDIPQGSYVADSDVIAFYSTQSPQEQVIRGTPGLAGT